MWLCSFPSNTSWKDSLFLISYSCLPCQRLIDHRCQDLLLGSLFCSIGLSVCFGTSTMLSWLLWLCIIAWILGELCLLLGFCSSGLLWQFWVLYGSTQIFGLFVVVLLQKCLGSFNRDCIEFVDYLGYYGYFNNVSSCNPWAWNIFPFLLICLNFLD